MYNLSQVTHCYALLKAFSSLSSEYIWLLIIHDGWVAAAVPVPATSHYTLNETSIPFQFSPIIMRHILYIVHNKASVACGQMLTSITAIGIVNLIMNSSLLKPSRTVHVILHLSTLWQFWILIGQKNLSIIPAHLTCIWKLILKLSVIVDKVK